MLRTEELVVKVDDEGGKKCLLDHISFEVKDGEMLVITGYELAILIIGMLTAFIVSILAIKFLMNYIKKNDFKPFGYYRIVLGILVLGYFLFLG